MLIITRWQGAYKTMKETSQGLDGWEMSQERYRIRGQKELKVDNIEVLKWICLEFSL